MPGTDEQADKLATALESSGYKPSRSFEIASSHEVWKHELTEVEVVMTAPTEPGQYPLIIYLPSLGEDANSGQLWREAWAKAGYAVFSMQVVAISQALKELAPEHNRHTNDDSRVFGGLFESDADKAKKRAAWTSRQSELRYIGHEYFGVDALKGRMEQLLWSYQQLKVRAALKQPLFTSAAVDQVILSGYDLGAQTAAAILGENFKSALPNNTELKPLAAIILSPSVDSAEGKANTRFQALNLPMLVITGSEDNDPYAISGASLRTVIWQASPPGDKFLLSLDGVRHQLLSGSEMSGHSRHGVSDDDAEQADIGNPEAADQRLESGSNRLGAHNRFGGTGGQHLPDGSSTKRADLGYIQEAAIISSSQAYLDAIIKKDEFSRFWLENKANQWLDQAGTLKIR